MDATTFVFYASARERLVGVTADADIIAAFDRLTQRAAEGDDNMTDAALGRFLFEARRLSLSLDYIFCGEGEPHMEWKGAN